MQALALPHFLHCRMHTAATSNSAVVSAGSTCSSAFTASIHIAAALVLLRWCCCCLDFWHHLQHSFHCCCCAQQHSPFFRDLHLEWPQPDVHFTGQPLLQRSRAASTGASHAAPLPPLHDQKSQANCLRDPVSDVPSASHSRGCSKGYLGLPGMQCLYRRASARLPSKEPSAELDCWAAEKEGALAQL